MTMPWTPSGGGSGRGGNRLTPGSQPLITAKFSPSQNADAGKDASPVLNNKRPLTDAINTHTEKYVAITCPKGVHFTDITNNKEDMDTSEGRPVSIKTDNPQYDNWAHDHELNLITYL